VPAPAVAPSLPPRGAADVALLEILVGPLRPGETAVVGFARKEHEVRKTLATLSLLEARALCTRLEACRSDDALALAFARLTVERRVRLLAYLGGARRREALGTPTAPR
jgi:hypothetical protein